MTVWCDLSWGWGWYTRTWHSGHLLTKSVFGSIDHLNNGSQNHFSTKTKEMHEFLWCSNLKSTLPNSLLEELNYLRKRQFLGEVHLLNRNRSTVNHSFLIGTFSLIVVAIWSQITLRYNEYSERHLIYRNHPKVQLKPANRCIFKNRNNIPIFYLFYGSHKNHCFWT